MSDQEPTTIGKQVIADRLMGLTDETTRSGARRLTDAFCAIIAEALVAGHAVHLPGVGTIRPRLRAGRTGQGLNGKPYATGPSFGLQIRMAGVLRAALNAPVVPEAAAA